MNPFPNEQAARAYLSKIRDPQQREATRVRLLDYGYHLEAPAAPQVLGSMGIPSNPTPKKPEIQRPLTERLTELTSDLRRVQDLAKGGLTPLARRALAMLEELGLERSQERNAAVRAAGALRLAADLVEAEQAWERAPHGSPEAYAAHCASWGAVKGLYDVGAPDLRALADALGGQG